MTAIVRKTFQGRWYFTTDMGVSLSNWSSATAAAKAARIAGCDYIVIER